MKNRIEVTKAGNRLNFYLHNGQGIFWLFTQHYTIGVYRFFATGRSESEIRNYHDWNRNTRLNKTIQ